MEVWYATITHRESQTGLWFRYTLTSPSAGAPYCELWAFAFGQDGVTFAGKNRYPIDRLGSSNGRDDGALVRIGDSWLSERHLEGEVTDGGRSLAWSLDLEPAEACFQHLPESIRNRIAKRVSTVCSPNLSVPFSGTVKLDDRIIELDGDVGCQSHRWGKRHSTTWAWVHCGEFDSEEGAVFEGVAAQAPLGGLPAPTMTFVYLSHGDREYAFNALKWAMRARSHYEMPTWAFTAKNATHKIVGAARARVDRMVQVTYEDPDSSKRYCANSEVADLALELFEKTASGWKHIHSFTASKNAHLEFGRPQPFGELPIAL